jgi:hypothetical protein
MLEIFGPEKGREVYAGVQSLFNSGYGYHQNPSR